jgi:chorismate mutase
MKVVSEEVMEFRSSGSNEVGNGSLSNRSAADVQVVVTVAHKELRRLLQERAEIMKRIGSIKQTIAGLCNLFGDAELSDDLRELVNGRSGVRRQGITQACRRVLMNADGPFTAQEVCQHIQPGFPCSKNLVASITTVLSRLVQYGEARVVPHSSGSRAWLWISESGDRSSHSADSAEQLVSERGLG